MTTWRVECGDCLELLRKLPSGSVDAVVTDPPYGINTKSDGSGKLNPWADLCNSAFWYAEWFRLCRSVLSRSGSFWTCLNWRSLPSFQKAACDVGWPIESLMVWDKDWIGPGGTRGLRPSYELVALLVMPDFSVEDRGISDVQKFPWSSQKPTGHPAEKPVDLFKFCVKHGSPRGGAVLDPFCGSGTCGVACVETGRRFLGFELDSSWVELSRRRISEAAPALFVPQSTAQAPELFPEARP